MLVTDFLESWGAKKNLRIIEFFRFRLFSLRCIRRLDPDRVCDLEILLHSGMEDAHF